MYHKPMIRLKKMIFICVLAFVLTSCGFANSSNTIPSANTVTIIGTNSTVDTPQSFHPAYNYQKSQAIVGLFIELKGFICAADGATLDNLTIASEKLSYDAGSAQIIQNYLQFLYEHSAELPTWIPPQPPKELQWVPGSTICTGNIAITNTTNTTIEVQKFGMQLTATPIVNSYNYRLVQIKECPGTCGGGPECAYQTSIILNKGITGTKFLGSISTNSDQCPLPLIIPASSSAEVSIIFQDAYTRSLIYTGTPFLNVETSSGEKTIIMSSFTSSLYFTHTDNFPYYQFRGNAFVPYTPS